MSIHHKNLASGQWQRLSLVEQMGNIGSEISRALKWQKKDQKLFKGAIDRAFELLDLTIADSRWQKQKRLKELTRVREVLADVVFPLNKGGQGVVLNKGGQGVVLNTPPTTLNREVGKEYQSSLKDLEGYFFHFALVARLKK